ncbi:MAG: TIR domain-containing protein [Steroidobacteraceae bacterium]|jgi:serine/threonine-protein kinase
MPEGAEKKAQSQPATGSTSIAESKVFISYASQDKAVADTIVAALEHAGISCWIAPRNVTAGAFYADAIVRAIDSASSLVLILSKDGARSRHVLRELERAASKRSSVIALKIDTEPLPAAFEYFLNSSQWLDASGGHPERLFPKLIEALRGVRDDAPQTAENPASTGAPTHPIRKAIVGALALVVATGIAYVVVEKPWHWNERAHREPASSNPTLAAPQPPPPAAFAPPPHSIAVMPFVNMSGDPKQEYFSDGVTEELLNSLSRLNELQVVARTSSFSFKGQSVDISTIAHKLNVGNVLEGSVRRAGDTVRITAQLINTVTGFHIWSQTYDRRFTDILKVQTEVATAVADRLKVTLAGDEAAKLGQGGTKSSEAYEAYLQGAQQLSNWDFGEADLRAALSAFDRAIALDPNFALAYERRALALNDISIFAARPSEIAEVRAQAVESAERAVGLAPSLGEIHVTLAEVYAYGQLDFTRAVPEFERALILSPGSARVQRLVAAFMGQQGQFQKALVAARRAVSLDPQNLDAYTTLGQVLTWSRDYAQALSVLHTAQLLRPDSVYVRGNIANALLASGAVDEARSLCESASVPLPPPSRQYCLALAYRQLGLQADAEHQFHQFKAAHPGASVEIAAVYAQWRDTKDALLELAKAERQKDSALQVLRISWALDPIRNEPQFKAIEARMNFPQE